MTAPGSRGIRELLLTVGGLGCLRPAPGTWGSLPLPILALAASSLPAWMVSILVGLTGLLFAIACLRFGGEAERLLGCKDPQQIVADEVAGQAVALLAIPWAAGDWGRNAAAAAVAFAAFRLFDITKPPPVSSAERLRGGAGILMDDLVAGGYAFIVTQVVVRTLVM